jgi:RHS repeat-associated protein
MRMAFRTVRRTLLLTTLALLATASRAAAQAETTEYYGTDAVGSVRIVFNASGAVLGRQDYDPFGREILAASGVPPERFGGQSTDGEVQQGYFHARQFQSRVGRFAAADPALEDVVDPQRWNRYSYGLNNPETFTDSNGLFPNISPGIAGFIGCKAKHFDFCGVDTEEGSTSYDDSDVIPEQTDPTAGTGGRPDGGRTQPGLQSDPPPTIPPPQDPPPNDPPPRDPPKPECAPGFIQSANSAWRLAQIGHAETESGFWIVDDNGTTQYLPLPLTNQTRTITNLRVPRGARGLFHTHPNSALPQPSPGDVRNSNNSGLPFYVGSSSGLWVHTPGGQQSSLLRSGTSWLKPCSTK